MLAELAMAGFVGFVCNLMFFGSVFYIAGRLGYLDTDEEKVARRHKAMPSDPAADRG